MVMGELYSVGVPEASSVPPVPAPDLLLRLLRASGPSGTEAAASAVWLEAASAFATTETDAVGNAFARVAGSSPEAPVLALFGHVDEIGIVVTHVSDEGYLMIRHLGGIDAQVLLGQRVELLTRNGVVPGVVSRRRDLEDKERVELRHLHVDVGARSREEALGLVRIGDPGVLASEPTELANGRLSSRALDNRIGAYVVLEVARRVAESGGAEAHVVAVASVQEEVGDFLGARTAAFGLAPAAGVAVDVTFATDVPGARVEEAGELRLGGGPAITRGPGLAPRLVELLLETAAEEAIAHSIEVSTGQSGTDADAVALTRAGIPVAVVSVPIRYFHTPVELVDLADLEAAVRLLTAAVRRIAPTL
jgi:endoglucanase